MQNNLEPNSRKKKALKSKGVNGVKSAHCHTEEEATMAKEHPDHTSALARLRKIKGQITGLEKMIEDKRYCVDILIQFRAIASALNVIEASIFERHIKSCVIDAVQSKNESEIQKKVDELTRLISKRL